ncbi:MAG: ribbon-helix-helix protein, CopG family [Candidatus Gastranaerophilales bacterium]|jgi:metal-responsive CopG/Arc/MetJ family transcriptional regulator|nr:ribbon-helix-helix protein, CopG family [Candidatus Gastranaerophilales bacterium]
MARILISMKDNFLKSIDELAQNEQRTRSELIREALRAYIKKANVISPKKAENNAKILENLLD